VALLVDRGLEVSWDAGLRQNIDSNAKALGQLVAYAIKSRQSGKASTSFFERHHDINVGHIRRLVPGR
jgi:hypothetical protein